ncbi:type VI secretion system-associated protein TagF [Gilvimarinus sp. F26214L]|uniref:type VI secretion system-associated protein TagF n=1 Tax=Gilvimarinus sp. DZF01 TaxID=3461371 RepID=UPI004045F3AC
MANSAMAGLYGKLPAHGDFIYRNLASNFINAWDGWLQGFVGSTQEQIGANWLDTYLTSPIWRFALSEGVIDQNAWAGIMLPSVDRVGRYFPFSIARPLDKTANPLELIGQTAWFEAVETAALNALDGRLVVDQLVEEINLPTLDGSNAYMGPAVALGPRGAVIELDEEAQQLGSACSFLLDAAIRESASSYSVWATRGSELVEPCFFYCRALPRLQGLAAMMDGRWSHWGWPEPNRMKFSGQAREYTEVTNE